MSAIPESSVAALPPAHCACLEHTRWRLVADGPVRIFLRGYVEGALTAALARSLARPSADPSAILAMALGEARGHFALVAVGAGWFAAAVDWVRSIPLFYACVNGRWTLDDRADRLRRAAGLGPGMVDADAALAIAMAGYTIDRATLYRGLAMLGPGECALFRPGAAPERRRYYAYRPWRIAERESARLESDLAETTLDIVARMLESLGGRSLVIPLSAGYDSRLIASAARHLGAKNVRCFAYGRSGNFEAVASRAIAERLGYRWAFAPLTISSQRRFFAGDTHRRYLDECDTCAAVPFVQDMSAILALRDQGFIPHDAVIANGNSGDYISGMHISPSLRALPAKELDLAARKARILDALADKHFALWQSLRTPEHLARIKALLWQSIEAGSGALDDPAADHGLYEYAEFQDRQCKYVINGQRIYDVLGHDWRLPLWDNAYLRFWESVPLCEKANQALYARMLHNRNWGGVWSGIPVNAKSIRPRWIAPLRYAAKLAHAPLGAERWHHFERKYFQYWMDLTCNAAVTAYAPTLRDRRGARHSVAWLAEDYLREKGVAFDDVARPRAPSVPETMRVLTAAEVEAHLPAFMAVGADIAGEYWQREHFLRVLPEKWTLSLGAWAGSAPLGYAFLSARGAGHAHLHHFAVAPERRRQGLGARLLAAAEENAAAHGFLLVTLKVPKASPAARRFYERQGYRENAVEADHWVMAKDLPRAGGPAH